MELRGPSAPFAKSQRRASLKVVANLLRVRIVEAADFPVEVSILVVDVCNVLLAISTRRSLPRSFRLGVGLHIQVRDDAVDGIVIRTMAAIVEVIDSRVHIFSSNHLTLVVASALRS